MNSVDAVVIGAGVVGLAVARALAREGLETLVLEREAGIGTQTSARNSEVIHAGLYYPAGSLKARLCVRGRALLYDFLADHGVAHRRCGKLIVATAVSQLDRLEAIRCQAADNGAVDLRWLSAGETRALEPALRVDGAILSPSTGIVDSHALMVALQGELEAAGGVVVLRSPVRVIARGGAGLEVEVGGAEPTRLACRYLVNAAGHWAPKLAASLSTAPRSRPAKGSYFTLAGRVPFRRLVYPVPEDGGLGVHLTLDLAGQARFGPDVEWFAPDADPDNFDYRVDPSRAAAFESAIRRWWPALPAGALVPAYSGVRPKVEGSDDFVFEGAEAHGIDGLMNLYAIESPGLTASLAIAEEVTRRLQGSRWPASDR